MKVRMKKYILEIKTHKYFYGAFLGIIILAALLRLYGLGQVPFVADEFLDVNATYGHYKTDQWQAWDFNRGEVSLRENKASDERAWLYRSQVSFLYNYLPPTEFVVRLVSALWGILTVVILYVVTLSFTKNRWIALVAAFLFAVSVPAIEMNRKIRMYSMFAPVFLLFSWSVFQFLDSLKLQKSTGNMWKGIFRLRYWYMVPVVVFGLISYHLHPLTGNIVFVLLVYFFVMAFVYRKRKYAKRYIVYILVMIGGLMGIKVLVPEVWDQFTAGIVFFDDHWSYIGHILNNYWHPILGGSVILLGAWYLVLKQEEDNRPGIWIVVTFFTILLAAIVLWNRNVGAQYIFFIQAFGCMLAAAGVYGIAEFFSKKCEEKKVVVKGVIKVVVLSCILLPAYGYFFQGNNTYNITSSSENANYRKVFTYIKKYANEDDVMITRNFRNYYWSGLGVQVFDFGSERSRAQLEQEGKVKKVTVEHVKNIMIQYPSGWVVYTDNDESFITKEARQYFEDAMMKIDDTPLVRGKVSVYRWERASE